MSLWRRYLMRLTGTRMDRDLEDLVPDDITVTGPFIIGPRGLPAEFGNLHWYVTARYDFGDDGDHAHVEIKLDKARWEQLRKSIAETHSS